MNIRTVGITSLYRRLATVDNWLLQGDIVLISKDETVYYRLIRYVAEDHKLEMSAQPELSALATKNNEGGKLISWDKFSEQAKTKFGVKYNVDTARRAYAEYVLEN